MSPGRISVNISPETKVGKIVTRIGDEIVVEINGQQKMTTIQKLKEKGIDLNTFAKQHKLNANTPQGKFKELIKELGWSEQQFKLI